MARTKILKSAGRFGVRYGQSVKRRITAIESIQRKKQACPLCAGRAVRISKGIWSCKKCGKKFAGHAYYLEPFIKPLRSWISDSSSEEEVLKAEKTSNNEEKKTKTKKSKSQ